MKTRNNGDADEAQRWASPVTRANGTVGELPAGDGFSMGDAPGRGLSLGIHGEDGSEDDIDQDSGDLLTGVDEEALDSDELDTDRVTSTVD